MNAIVVACKYHEGLTLDWPRHHSRSYRMHANRSSFNS